MPGKRRWSEKEKKLARNMKLSAQEVAAKTGRSVPAVWTFRSQLRNAQAVKRVAKLNGHATSVEITTNAVDAIIEDQQDIVDSLGEDLSTAQRERDAAQEEFEQTQAEYDAAVEKLEHLKKFANDGGSLTVVLA